jgi:hypothetical protein
VRFRGSKKRRGKDGATNLEIASTCGVGKAAMRSCRPTARWEGGPIDGRRVGLRDNRL